MSALEWVIILAVGAAFTISLAALMRHENRHDDRLAGFPQPEHPGFGDIRQSVQSLTWDDIAHHQYLLTSPPGRNGGPPDYFAASGGPGPQAGTPASPATHSSAPPACPGTGAGPGDDAAAAVAPLATPPATAPPPLPSPIDRAARIAACHPGTEPFELWESDEFVERRAAYARDAGDQVMASYHTPLGGAQ